MRLLGNRVMFKYLILSVCGLSAIQGQVTSRPSTGWVNQSDLGDQPDQRTEIRLKRSSFECGVHRLDAAIPKDSQLKGPSRPGEWPWLVALFHISGSGLSYMCGATLIDNRCVITVAHCIHNQATGKQMNTTDIVLIIGAWDLSRVFYDEGITRSIAAMYVPPEYDTATNNNNIALLVLKDPVAFSDLVKPVCLWEDEDDSDNLWETIQHGTVVGWGEINGVRSLEEPQSYNVSLISFNDCIGLHTAYATITNEKTFCAVNTGNETICRGFSGSGLYIEQRGRWMLQGMVSRTITVGGSKCDGNRPIVYTDVAKYKNWIDAIVNDWSKRTSSFECGVHRLDAAIPKDSQLKGPSRPGEWPWLVALFHISGSGLSYTCGASLIDNRCVITVAHCIHNQATGKQMNTTDIVLIIGAWDLSRVFYDEGITRSIAAMYVPPEYDTATNNNNIALLVLKDPVAFSDLVKPVCLWEDEDDSDNLGETIQHGTVVGWGEINGKRSLEEPHSFNTSLISSNACIGLHTAYATITNEKTFCAVNTGNETICRGFSGSGLCIEQHGRWMLRGMVSRTITVDGSKCDRTHPIVYTDVAKYKNWIDAIVYYWSKRTVPSGVPLISDVQAPFMNTTNVPVFTTTETAAWTQQCSVRDEANPLVTAGQTTRNGEWPWHVAIYHNEHEGGSSLIRYKCGGSLISDSHVLTAAHCVTNKLTKRPVSTRGINVFLGTRNIKTFSQGVQIKLVDRLQIHPEYDAQRQYKDIAVLKLSTPADLTAVVRPVCLWPEDKADLSNVVDKYGSVVGWGNDEYGLLADELMLAELPVVSEVTCLRSHPFYQKYTNSFTFCAGLLQGTSVCNGDSGGGMVFKLQTSPETEEWFLRGIVSLSPARGTTRQCDPSRYAVFTDVAKFLVWIKESVSGGM